MTYEQMPVAAIEPNPDQPRKHFDPAALQELAGSIAKNGLLEPIIVRPVDGPGERHVIIAGERRWRASQIANLDAVPVRVLDIGEEEAFVLSIAENVNREDMNPMEEADAFARLLDYGRTREQVAELFGKTTRFVGLRLDLLDLRDEIKDLVRAGTMATSVAQQVSRCSVANQQSVLFKFMRGDFANDNEAIHFAYALHQAEAQAGFFDVEEPDEEERSRRGAVRKTVLGMLTRVEKACDIVDEIAGLDPDTLADAFAGDGQRYLDRLDRLAKAVTAARFNARQGNTLAEARDIARVNVEINPEATA